MIISELEYELPKGPCGRMGIWHFDLGWEILYRVFSALSLMQSNLPKHDRVFLTGFRFRVRRKPYKRQKSLKNNTKF